MKTYKTTQNGPVKIYDSDCEPKWISIEDKLPPIDEEVIVLTDEFNTAPIYKIGFGHIVDKNIAVDYNGWNIPGVKYWMPCPKIPEK